MSQNDSGQHAPATLISLRRSYQLAGSGIMVLGVGLWLVIGLFGLFGHSVAEASISAGWAYLVVGLVLLPTSLSYLELRSWVGHSGGSYRLIRAMERNNLTFFAGWTYILGWGAVSGLILHIYMNYAGSLLTAATSYNNTVLLQLAAAAVLFLLFLVTNTIGARPAWRITISVVGLMILSVLVLTGMAATQGSSINASTMTTAPGQNFFRAVAVLIATQWATELLSEAGDRRKHNTRLSLLVSLGGPVLAALLAFVSIPFSGLLKTAEVSDTLYLPALAETIVPGYGELVATGVGTVVSGLAWLIMGLVMLRRFQIISLDGWMPRWLTRPYLRFKTPLMLILIVMLISPLTWLAGSGLVRLPGDLGLTSALASMASIAFLLITLGVNIAAIMLGTHPRAKDRSLKLPLYPVIPAVGAAIGFLLILAIPLPVVIVTLLWLALGLLLFWQVALDRMRDARLGVTVFQDISVQKDLSSPFPVVVPVANPATALNLVAFGAALARQYGGHVSVVQVLQVPDHQPLVSERVQAKETLDLLEHVLEQTKDLGVPIEGITRLSRSISQGILDTVAEEGARLLVMGWGGQRPKASPRNMGNVLDTILENAPCDVVIIRGQWAEAPKNAIVPIAGGANAPRAAELALALTAQTGGEVTLINIARHSTGPEAVDRSMQILKQARADMSQPERVQTRVVSASSPAKGILEAAEGYDILLLGTSQGGVLENQFFGKLPHEVAENTDQLLVMVRSYAGLPSLVARKAWVSLSEILPTLNISERIEIYHQMRQAAQPNINFFVLIAVSALIATLGLMQNSPAVIIGAMLVAPLMSPIVSTGVGIVTGDIFTIRNGLTATLQGVLISIFLAILAAVLSPTAAATPEIIARTQPNLLDLLVALVSGIAGAYAIGRKEVGEALPGVAIAAALMPPVCTIGIGIALGNASIAFGATLLFVTNLIAIIFASAIVFLLLGMRPLQQQDSRRWLSQGLSISIGLLVIISIPLGGVLFRSAQQSKMETQAYEIIQTAVDEWGNAELADFNTEVNQRSIKITGIVYTEQDASSFSVGELEQELEDALRKSVTLELFAITGTSLDSD